MTERPRVRYPWQQASPYRVSRGERIYQVVELVVGGATLLLSFIAFMVLLALASTPVYP